MKRTPWLISAALAAGFFIVYLSGLASVPFHPDESSWLYMSQDLTEWANRAASPWPAWFSGHPEGMFSYRLLNAPLPKYLMGLSWRLSGHSQRDLNADWVWPMTWDENVAAGHLPTPALLWAGRLPGAALSALAAGVMFWIGYEAGGFGVGVMAALLLGLNPLVLLHGRRAMAEGAALFFSLLAVWGMLRLARVAGEPHTPIRKIGLSALGAGLLVGLDVSSKQTGVALLLAAGAAVTLPMLRGPAAQSWRLRWQRLAGVWLALGLGCGVLFWALNPILYRDPVGGAQAMLAARTYLVRLQMETQAAFLPESVTPDIVTRLRAALMEVYFRPPAVWDVPVYLDQLRPQAAAYLAQPLNRLTGGPVTGALMAGLGVAGMAFGALRLTRDRLGPVSRPEQAIWWWALSTVGLILFSTPFDWQRYFMPLVPLACLFAAFGAEALARPVARLLWRRPRPPDAR